VQVVVMTVMWEDLRGELIDRLGVGIETLWSLIFAAQSGVLALALIEPLDGDLALSDAAEAMAEALEELERVDPALASGGIAVDLDPVQLDGLTGYRTAIAGLLTAAGQVVALMLREHVEELDTSGLLALASVASLIGSGREFVTGVVL
jgi:hypothetical protein